jgi:hypothetical protein
MTEEERKELKELFDDICLICEGHSSVPVINTLIKILANSYIQIESKEMSLDEFLNSVNIALFKFIDEQLQHEIDENNKQDSPIAQR